MMNIKYLGATSAIFAAMVSVSLWAKSPEVKKGAEVTASTSAEQKKFNIVYKNTQASADNTVPAKVVENLKKVFLERNNAKVTDVRSTPLAGVYEVQIGSELFYSDASADYIMVGELMDFKNNKNLTQTRVAQMQSIEFSSLPKQLAIKYTRGNGQREIALFEDPYCSYCRKQQAELQQLNDVTVYVFLTPILTADSVVKARNVWCSNNPGKTYVEWMVTKKEPPKAGKACVDMNTDTLALAKQLEVQGTPTIYLTDGRRIGGFQTAQQLEAQFKEIYSKK